MEQKDLADAVGVSRPLVSKWERDLAVPSVVHAARIAEVTKHSLGWLAGVDPILTWKWGSTPLTCQKRLFDVEPLGKTHQGELVLVGR